VTWLPFDLHPEYPSEGFPWADLVRSYGDAFHQRLRALFDANGLVYNPHREVVPNSLAALRLTELARDAGLHPEFHDRLMDAYWELGENIGDLDVLRRHAAEDGLPVDDVERVLSGDKYLERVRASTAEAQSIGVTGVPAFLLDSRLLVLGAQPREVFEQAFTQLETAA
jgi:predicted DsbA family dithiol-disulfide isomerase